TTGTGLDITSTSTAGGASGVSKLLNLARSGTNANASHTTYGLYSAVTNSGTTSTNIGGYFSASGATNNYGLIVENGNVGIGTAAPVSTLDVRGTIENGLVGWWPMDEGSGSTVNDYSINGNNGTFVGSSCPVGYVLVPGNATYSTSDFCVMQYEAKNDGASNAISQAGTTPWVSITQTDAITECSDAGGHLITNNEWMTIARNAEAQATNWADGTIGSLVSAGGGLKRGNVGIIDSASYNGSDPEFGTGRDTKAKFTLSNGETIWDFSGNVWEWTNDTIACAGANCTTGEMPYDATPASEWIEFTAINTYGQLSYDKIRPSNSSWNANYGSGRLYTDADAAYPSGNTHAFLRGGNWYDGAGAGAFMLTLSDAPSYSYTSVGFRCVR
ncbi:MAG: SUMF1/EgtB/PvdO family nonheme iron enzyme, partial [Patescibacteria group bacterium]|nr:SUMF1/EgtB/PvdO family nonheme iron enzyme [Patescibacteria group bacterium]